MSTTMKTILICPEHRAASGAFHHLKPLALMPVLGRNLIVLHLQALAAKDAKDVLILASDRPELIREAVGNGAAWGLNIEVLATRGELTAEEATMQYAGRSVCQVIVVDSIPGVDGSLWHSYEGTFTKLAELMNEPVHAESLTMKEMGTNIWISTKARIAEGASITGPAWIGPHARIAKGANIGPRTVIEGHAFVDEHVALSDTWVGPSTYIGPAMDIESSFVWGQSITNWRDGALLEVADEFVLNDLSQSAPRRACVSWAERFAALFVMILTSPIVSVAMMCSWMQNLEATQERRVILPPLPRVNAFTRTHSLRQLNLKHLLLRRWPELWQVVRGYMALVGNRPLSLKEATSLRGEMGQLWLSVPAGVLSLADSEGEARGDVTASIAHAAYFATHRSLRLKLQVIARCARQLFKPNTLQ